MKKDFITSVNNSEKFYPTYYFNIDDYEVEGKTILHILVPESSQVHRLNGRIFDRNGDADLDITNNHNLVADMFIRKQRNYTENQVYPYVTLDDLRIDLIEKVRKRAVIERADHPWKDLHPAELLKSAGMFLKDFYSGKEGFTLAAVLVFGKDEVIRSVLPYHRIDAILRKIDIDRYDDRDDIRTNLIDSYDRLVAFIHKHLPDIFFLEGMNRKNIRDIIFREIITNLLIHREYSNAYPTKLIIGRDSIITENANKPHGYGVIDPENFSPYPKNPVIAGIFKEMGLIDELGSGVRNLYKYSKIYFGSDPKLIEDNVFKTIIELKKTIHRSYEIIRETSMVATMEDTMEATVEVDPYQYRTMCLLKYIKERPKSARELMMFLKLSNKEYFRIEILNPLIKEGKVLLTTPDKPTSPKQKYYSK
jgi:ATP-dependent DNA helicase RecG